MPRLGTARRREPPASGAVPGSGGSKYMWAVAFAAGMGGMLFGYEIGIINQILSITSFLFYFKIYGLPDDAPYNPDIDYNPEDLAVLPTTDQYKGFVTSSFLYGCVGGAAVVSFLADAIGRKFSIILGGIIYTAGGSLQAAAVNLPIFLFARALSGMSVGIMSMSVPLYIAETSPTVIRGRLTTVYQLMITFGILIASCVNGIIVSVIGRRYDLAWRLAFALQVIPGATLLVLMLPMPRSPRWLAEKGFHSEGQRVIARLRGFEDEDDDEVIIEYRSIVAGVEYERRIGTAGWNQLLTRGVRRRLAFGVVNQFFQQWTGINVILYYGYDLFKQLDFGNVNSSVVFIIVNAFINFAFTLPGMWGVERFGRRPLFIFGGIAMCTAYCVVFVFASLAPHGRGYAWVAVLGIYFFTISFACTWGPVVWTYQSEIFPLRIRAKGTGLSTMSNWIWNAVIAQIQPSLNTSLHTSLYLIFAGTCFLMTIYAWHFIPETRGKTLEEMDEVFKDSDAVLPSEHVEWSATVAALFTLRGIRSHPRHDESSGTSGPRSNAKDTGSLSSLSPPSASSVGVEDVDKISSSSGSSSAARGRKMQVDRSKSSNPYGVSRATSLSPESLSHLMTLGVVDDPTGFNLPPNITTPFSASKKPKSSAMKKTMAGSASPQANYALTDELIGGPVPFTYTVSSTSSASSSRQRSRSVGSTASKPDEDRSFAADTISNVPPSAAAIARPPSGGDPSDDRTSTSSTSIKPPPSALSSSSLRANSLTSTPTPSSRPTPSPSLPQWPPAFVVRLGHSRPALHQQQQQHQPLRSTVLPPRRGSSPATVTSDGAALARTSAPPTPPPPAPVDPAAAAAATSPTSPTPPWRRDRAVGVPTRAGRTAPAAALGDAFALPTAPARTPRSRSVDTGRSSSSAASSGAVGLGLGSWMIEEDDAAEFARR